MAGIQVGDIVEILITVPGCPDRDYIGTQGKVVCIDIDEPIWMSVAMEDRCVWRFPVDGVKLVEKERNTVDEVDFKVGDKVLVHRWKDRERGTKWYFEKRMEFMLGNIYRVHEVHEDYCCLHIPEKSPAWDGFGFPKFALEKVGASETCNAQEESGSVEFGILDSKGLW